MITLQNSVCIDASPEQVWQALSRLEDIQLWSGAVVAARCEGDLSQGIGAERTCDLKGNITIKEKWLAWDEGHSFSYEGVGIPLVKRAVNTWSVHAEGDKTLLKSDAEVEFSGGMFAGLLALIMLPQMKRMGPTSLAAFKYLVENGEAPTGKHADSLLVPAVC